MVPDRCYLFSAIGSLLSAASPIPKILRILVRIAEIIVDEHRRLPGKFEPLAALVAGNQVFQAHHVGCGLRELAAVFFACPARKFLFLAADLPAHRRFKFTAATGAY